jgi:hypothetical protein
MEFILLFVVFSFSLGYCAYWYGYQSRSALINELRRDRRNLEKWLDRQTEALIQTDLELELERIKHAR